MTLGIIRLLQNRGVSRAITPATGIQIYARNLKSCQASAIKFNDAPLSAPTYPPDPTTRVPPTDHDRSSLQTTTGQIGATDGFCSGANTKVLSEDWSCDSIANWLAVTGDALSVQRSKVSLNNGEVAVRIIFSIDDKHVLF